VTVAGKSLRVPVSVTGVSATPVVGFTDSVLPILSRAGCNAGACHAAQYGQGGFKLSVFASEPQNDAVAIGPSALGRRIAPVDPGRSLLLLKGTASVPHGGGKRLEGIDTRILQQWIAAGAPGPVGSSPTVTDLEVWPARRLGPVGLTQ